MRPKEVWCLTQSQTQTGLSQKPMVWVGQNSSASWVLKWTSLACGSWPSNQRGSFLVSTILSSGSTLHVKQWQAGVKDLVASTWCLPSVIGWEIFFFHFERKSSEDKVDSCFINKSFWLQLIEGILDIKMVLITTIIKLLYARWAL